jgi:2-phosphosulfolactate phosphatase
VRGGASIAGRREQRGGAMIDVALTRAEIRAAPTIVVIDALRATSTIVQALAGGYARVECCSRHEVALSRAAADRVLAGEIGCLAPPGFDLGNSPREVIEAKGTELALATTNGTGAIVAAAATGGNVLIGALLNVNALVARLDGDVLLACAGTEGRLSIEDLCVAGRIAARLEGPRTDAALAAEAVARNAAASCVFETGTAAARLHASGLGEDVAWCARESEIDIVPAVVRRDDDVAVVEPLPRGTIAPTTAPALSRSR